MCLFDWCCLTAGPSSLKRQGDCKNIKISSELDLKTGKPPRAVKLALRPLCSLWAKGVQALILFVQFRLPPRTSYSSDPWRPLFILKPASQFLSPDCGETQALAWLGLSFPPGSHSDCLRCQILQLQISERGL